MTTTQPRRRGAFVKLLIILLLVLLAFFLLLQFLPQLVLGERETILIVGADKRPGESQYRADAIVLAFCDWQSKQIELVSIPRDSYVRLSGQDSKAKINEAYFYGGVELLQNTIQDTLDVHIDHYLALDFEAFAAVVDALGGVELDVPYDMYKPWEEIDLKQGRQVLNGKDALGFVRYRDLPQGDIDRIANQQQFLKALSSQLNRVTTIFRLPRLAQIALTYGETDCSLLQTLALGSGFVQADRANLGLQTLPGEARTISRRSYWVLYQNKSQELLLEVSGGQAGTAINTIQ